MPNRNNQKETPSTGQGEGFQEGSDQHVHRNCRKRVDCCKDNLKPETHGAVALSIHKSEPRVDSRHMALNLGNQHHSVFDLISKYKGDFEQLGILRFQTEVIKGRGQPEKFAFLNEDQSYLLLSYSRNTVRVRELKVRLVKAFCEARRAVGIRAAEYLPEYHRLHDAVSVLAHDSDNERYVHMNLNKLVNKVAGIDPGQRHHATAPTQSLLAVAQAIATNALQGAIDHRDGYQRAKVALASLTAVLPRLEVAHA
jgi:phage regulator Rha-like protein